MKKISKDSEPSELQYYRHFVPKGIWDEMKSDAINKGIEAYNKIVDSSLITQHYICAYCEISLESKNERRIEHYHQKSDYNPNTGGHNWNLDWNNIFVVCKGGSSKNTTQAGHYLEPLKKNLSCDNHKNILITKGKLNIKCEGYLIDPLTLPDDIDLFTFNKATNNIVPNEDNCSIYTFSTNHYNSTKELVEKTIEHLNLNCNRLNDIRAVVKYEIENDKKKFRKIFNDPEKIKKAIISRHLKEILPFHTTRKSLLKDYL